MHAANPLPEMLSRPIVRVVSDDAGNLAASGHARRPRGADVDDGVFRRTIIKTENPDRYGIRVGDYFV